MDRNVNIMISNTGCGRLNLHSDNKASEVQTQWQLFARNILSVNPFNDNVNMNKIRRLMWEKYGLNSSATSWNFAHFLSLAGNPYAEVMQAILNKSPEAAIKQDFLAVAQDFEAVFKRESRLVDAERARRAASEVATNLRRSNDDYLQRDDT